jgi:hypothetical protein
MATTDYQALGRVHSGVHRSAGWLGVWPSFSHRWVEGLHLGDGLTLSKDTDCTESCRAPGLRSHACSKKILREQALLNSQRAEQDTEGDTGLILYSTVRSAPRSPIWISGSRSFPLHTSSAWETVNLMSRTLPKPRTASHALELSKPSSAVPLCNYLTLGTIYTMVNLILVPQPPY